MYNSQRLIVGIRVWECLAFAALLVQIALPSIALAHGSHEDRLRGSSARIAKNPGDPRAFLERAQLYREVGRHEEALADLARAAALAPGLPEVALLRARLHMDAGLANEALLAMDTLIVGHGHLGEARRIRALALEQLDRRSEAADEHERALERLEHASPDDYIHVAGLLATLEPRTREREQAVLERGIERLGPAPAMVARVVELEQERGRLEQALRWHDRLRPPRGPDPEWLARRGELLDAAGRRLEAEAAWTSALYMIQALPASRRSAPATKALEAKLLGRLRPSPNPR